MIRQLCLILLLTSFVASAVQAQSGVWVEVGDAPEGVPDRQDTVGLGALMEIRGDLDRPRGDHVDTFGIVIDDAAAFSASTSLHLGGSLLGPNEALLNTRVWLWAISEVTEQMAEMQLANDDDAFDSDDFGSTVSDPSIFSDLTMGLVDASAANISLESGASYLLSISTFDNDPVDEEGLPLADIDPARLTDLYGPNRFAGSFDQWENDPTSNDAGSYVIAVRGARFFVTPEPSSMLLGMLGAALLLRSTQRRGQETSGEPRRARLLR